MNKHSMIFIGLDTHKEFHEVAYCEEQRGASPVHYGRISSSKVSVKKLLRTIFQDDITFGPNLKVTYCLERELNTSSTFFP